jgi:L-alanine-DL-glutamate epimerase-like enolase superfamily enzyme
MITSTTITRFEYSKLDLPLTEPFAIASGVQHEAKNVLVLIQLRNGTIGIGEAAPFPAVSGETQEGTMKSLEKLSAYMTGKDVRHWQVLAKHIYVNEPAASAACCAVEMAMLDALTKYYSMPLYIFFGGAGTKLITDMTITAGDIAHASKSAKEILKRGISTIKIKTSGENIDFDVERVRAISLAAPVASLIIDGNCGYSDDSSIEFIDRLHSLNIKPVLFEQPLPREDWKGMARLVREAGLPIAADESARSAADVLKLVDEKAAHVINIKMMKCGVAESLKMISIAEAAGLQLMIGGMVESILSMTFSAHLAAGKGTFKFIDLDTPMFIKDHPFTGGFSQTGETLTLHPEEAGHGVNLK